MSRANIVLTAVLGVVVGIWWMTSNSDSDKPSGLAPRLFPDFNKEAVDSIVIEGGWEKTRWVFSRLGSQWTLSSAGGYPAVAETVNGFIDAVYHLRKDALVGSSDALRKSSRTGGNGRLVRLFRGDTPMAEFRVGKTPEDSTQTYFVRREDGNEVYRTRTLLTRELDRAPSVPASLWDTGPSGYRWSDYTNQVTDWLITQLWRLGSAETQKVKLTREGKYEVELTRKSDEEWELQEVGKPEKVPADTDAVSGIYDDLRYLNFVDVLGKHEDVYEEYGLDKPEIILILTLKKKIKKPEEEPDDDPKDDEKKDDKDEKKDEYRVFKRFLEIGKKISRPSSYDDETGKAKEDTYYAVHIGGEFDEDEKETEERSKYVFLVDAVNLRGLRKELDELKQKPAEEEEEEDGDEGDGENKDDPKQDDPKQDDPKQDDPKQDDPKQDDPKQDDPKQDDPKQDDPKQDDPKQDDPKQDDPKQDDPKQDDPEPKQDDK